MEKDKTNPMETEDFVAEVLLQGDRTLSVDDINFVSKKLGETFDKAIKQRDGRILELEALLRGRAGKLLKKGKPFIVIAIDEPYFKIAYSMIRAEEMANRTWSDYDEKLFRFQTERLMPDPISDIVSEDSEDARAELALAWALTESSNSPEALHAKTLADEVLQLRKKLSLLQGIAGIAEKEASSLMKEVKNLRSSNPERIYQTDLRFMNEGQDINSGEGSSQQED